MKTINLWFSDFYLGFDPKNNYLYNLLSEYYSVDLTSESPDYLIFSCYGNDFLSFNCIRIYYTGENLRPDFNLCDYAIGFDHMKFGDRYLRYPNYAFFEDQFLQLLRSGPLDESKPKNKDHFCNFIYGNSQADPVRDKFFHLLNEYKNVSSPGKHLNNTSLEVGERFSDDWMYTKLNFQSRCKFTLAFENTSSPGYTTEKLMHAFISRTVPIYWGNPEVTKDFNPNSFINCHDYNNFEEVLERVKEVDQNQDLFNKILSEPPFRDNTIPSHLQKENLVHFLKNILDKKLNVAKLRPEYGNTFNYEKNFKDLYLVKSRYKKIEPYLRYFKFLKNNIK